MLLRYDSHASPGQKVCFISFTSPCQLMKASPPPCKCRLSVYYTRRELGHYHCRQGCNIPQQKMIFTADDWYLALSGHAFIAICFRCEPAPVDTGIRWCAAAAAAPRRASKMPLCYFSLASAFRVDDGADDITGLGHISTPCRSSKGYISWSSSMFSRNRCQKWAYMITAFSLFFPRFIDKPLDAWGYYEQESSISERIDARQLRPTYTSFIKLPMTKERYLCFNGVLNAASLTAEITRLSRTSRCIRRRPFGAIAPSSLSQ